MIFEIFREVVALLAAAALIATIIGETDYQDSIRRYMEARDGKKGEW